MKIIIFTLSLSLSITLHALQVQTAPQWQEVYLGIWRTAVGKPEKTSLLSTAAIQPDRGALAKLPKVTFPLEKADISTQVIGGIRSWESGAYHEQGGLVDAIIALPVLCDMEKPANVMRIVNGAMIEQHEAYLPKSWILHPQSITCSVSEDGVQYRMIDTQKIEGDQKKEDITKNFVFEQNLGAFRYVKFVTIQPPLAAAGY